MNSLELVESLYPDYKEEDYFYGPVNYQPLLESFGEILLQVDDSDYQGDSRLVLKKDNNYGLLIFGWGSCSGCDALQACESYQDIEELRESLESSITWMTKEELLSYFLTHDWEGDFSLCDETKQFVADGVKLLSV